MRNAVPVSVLLLFVSALLVACGGGDIQNTTGGYYGGPPNNCDNPIPFNGYNPLLATQNGDITQNYNLESNCYLINKQISVRNSATLYIAPKTTLVFTNTGSLTANGGGIIANGDAFNPIYFTGQIKQPGSWPGVRILQSGNMSHIFNYVTIEYAGNFFNSTQELFSFGIININNNDTGGRITFTNNTIRKSGGKFAFYADKKSFFDKISGNTFYDNSEYPVYMTTNELQFLDGSNRMSLGGIGNGVNKVFVGGNTINTFSAPEAKYAPNISWYNLGVPYLITEDVTLLKTNLELQAGTEIQFSTNAGFNVTDDTASLHAKGTPTNQVLFTLEDEFVVPSGGVQTNFWDGLFFNKTYNPNNKLEYTIIEYGGVTTATGRDPANLIIGDGSNVSVSNTTLRLSSGYGMLVQDDALIPVFSQNLLTRNQMGAAKTSSRAVRFLDSSSNYTGNTLDWVEVFQGGVNGGEVWNGINVPYAFLDNEHLIIDGRLTIDAGSTLLFDDSVKMEVSSSGSLYTTGTNANPVTLTSVSQYFGTGINSSYWQGLFFKDSVGKLEYTDISYAGYNSGSFNTQPAAVTLSSLNNSSRTQLTINGVSIDNIYPGTAWGIYVDGNSTLLQQNSLSTNFQICNQATGICGQPF
ncbi:MAG: hypothetical protein R3240_01765 [Gammaproteobacteria bacterium]|nr:hypothetical protein [Gammaproteobacteria bacterium]